MTLNTIPSIAGVDEKGEPTDNPKLAMLEVVCIMWFTIEYCLRLAGAPKKKEFLKDGMNIIDILAILPYFVSIFLIEASGKKDSCRIGIFAVILGHFENLERNNSSEI